MSNPSGFGTYALGDVRENVRATGNRVEAIVCAGSRTGAGPSWRREYRARHMGLVIGWASCRSGVGRVVCSEGVSS
jgi:hypothetical protein